MLGKLFSLSAAAGSGSSAQAGHSQVSPEPVSTLESVQEDAHSRYLLYPDTQALFQHRHDLVFPLPSSPHLTASVLASAFDYDGDIDLDMRDVRVLVMQDGLSSIPSCVLYDSQQPPPLPPPDRPSTMAGLSQGPSRRMPTSPRKPSLSHTARPLVIQPDSPQLRQGSTFDRRPSVHTRTHSRLETEAHKAYREYAEELSVFSGCIFGNSELLAYRGTSTKVHILPSDPRTEAPSSLIHDGRGSLGRSSMRSSKLSQSFSSESATLFTPPPTSSTSSVAAGSMRTADRKKVLITRLFPVSLPSDEDNTQVSAAHSGAFEDRGSTSADYSFPAETDEATLKMKRKAHLKQKRTPMYAIALIVNLPQPPTLPIQSSSASRTTFRGPSSYSELESFSSSYGSGRRTGWSMASAAAAANSGLGIDMSSPEHPPMTSSGVFSVSTDLEERIDPITQHWDIIMRALTQMQGVVSATVSRLLRAIDISSPDPYPSTVPLRIPRTSFSGRREDAGGPMKPAKTNAKLITLMPNALMEMDRIARESDNARIRIAVGLRALRVVTGQNRWGIWREEARWITRWAAVSMEQHLQDSRRQLGIQKNEFFRSLLTAFLATHIDWLESLCPVRHRRRLLYLQSAKGDDVALPARTIIVSHDKNAARRLIFLLSAFLPATQSLPGAAIPRRPSTSMSWGALSQSPPASYIVPILKEESLRRKINRRAGDRRSSHSRNLSLQGSQGNVAGSAAYRSASTSAVGISAPLAQLNLTKASHDRRPSDTSSIRTANLPISGNNAHTQKSSTAAMATVTSEATIPHFATLQRLDSPSFVRPDSASSAAEDDLKRALRRGDSNSSQTSNPLYQQLQGSIAATGSRVDARNQGSRWSVLGGLLGGRRRDSTSNAGTLRHGRNISTSSARGAMNRRDNLSPSSPRKVQYGPDSLQQSQQSQHKTTSTGQASSSTAHESPKSQPTASASSAKETEYPQTPHLSGDNPVSGNTRREEAFRTLVPAGAFESPVKTTINPEDGVIDVDIQFPDYLRSFETAVSSPSSSGFLSTPGFGSGFGSAPDYFEHPGRSSADNDLPANVAGWLQSYHPDFALQSIPPQDNLLAQVKESLRNEPTPISAPPVRESSQEAQSENPQRGEDERWVDVSSAIIVDMIKWTICRLRYSRLVRVKAAEATSPGSGTGYSASAGSVQETQLEERFVQEEITSRDKDSVLEKAVERIIAPSVSGRGGTGGSGGGAGAGAGAGTGAGVPGAKAIDIVPGSSNSSSRSASALREHSNSVSIGSEEAPRGTAEPIFNPSTPTTLADVPRGECKAVILAALAEVVRDALQSSELPDSPTDAAVQDSAPIREDGKARSILREAVISWFERVDTGEA